MNSIYDVYEPSTRKSSKSMRLPGRKPNIYQRMKKHMKRLREEEKKAISKLRQGRLRKPDPLSDHETRGGCNEDLDDEYFEDLQNEWFDLDEYY